MKSKVEDHHSNEDVHEDASPLTKVLLELRSHYLKNENKFGIEELVSALENNSNVDIIYELISTNAETWKSTKTVNLNLFSKFDELIESDKRNE